MTGSELVAVADFSLLHDFCHGLASESRQRVPAILQREFDAGPCPL